MFFFLKLGSVLQSKVNGRPTEDAVDGCIGGFGQLERSNSELRAGDLTRRGRSDRRMVVKTYTVCDMPLWAQKVSRCHTWSRGHVAGPFQDHPLSGLGGASASGVVVAMATVPPQRQVVWCAPGNAPPLESGAGPTALAQRRAVTVDFLCYFVRGQGCDTKGQ